VRRDAASAPVITNRHGKDRAESNPSGGVAPSQSPLVPFCPLLRKLELRVFVSMNTRSRSRYWGCHHRSDSSHGAKTIICLAESPHPQNAVNIRPLCCNNMLSIPKALLLWKRFADVELEAKWLGSWPSGNRVAQIVAFLIHFISPMPIPAPCNSLHSFGSTFPPPSRT